MDFVQEIGDFLDLVNYDDSSRRIAEQAFPEHLRILLVTSSQIGFEQVNEDSLGKTLFQKCGFTHLTAAKQEHSLIQPILYIKYSMIHNCSEFPQSDCGFSRNIRNDSANLTKFI